MNPGRCYRIGEVSRLLGETTWTLRYWESEFRLRIQRTKRGQRIYTEGNVERLKRIRHLLRDRGLTIAGARRALRSPDEHPTDAARWLTVIVREQTFEVTAFKRKQDAAAYFDRARRSRSESYLCEIVRTGSVLLAERSLS